MKIAFVHSSSIYVPSDGTVIQGLSWKRGLEELGHEVVLVNMWEKNDWTSFDVIHFFSFGLYMEALVNWLHKEGHRMVLSPILDPSYPLLMLKLYARWGIKKAHLTNDFHGLYAMKNKIDLFLTRSCFEKEYITKGFGVNPSRCRIVPLSYGIEPTGLSVEKEPFCLHISLLTDKRKNVERLVEAAVKYDFPLMLGGRIRNDAEMRLLDSWITGYPNVTYIGFLSEEQKMELYSRAKVFALPSTNEGVGLVALEAAAMNCEIAITSLGGPKEYYNGMAGIVDPYSVDDIGQTVRRLLDGDASYQPDLGAYVRAHYTHQAVARLLVESYLSLR